MEKNGTAAMTSAALSRRRTIPKIKLFKKRKEKRQRKEAIKKEKKVRSYLVEQRGRQLHHFAIIADLFIS